MRIGPSGGFTPRPLRIAQRFLAKFGTGSIPQGDRRKTEWHAAASSGENRAAAQAIAAQTSTSSL
jgi:hypothetical protein